MTKQGILIDITGRTFGRWEVLSRVENSARGLAMWLCRCSCESKTEGIVSGRDLRNGHSRSCGCLRKEISGIVHRTHGLKSSPEHNSWSGMIQRCTNPNNGYFRNYGARGIKVCRRWLKFENFLADMGERPEPKRNYSIERRDNNANYTPGNCYWATKKIQGRNTRNVKLNPGKVQQIKIAAAEGQSPALLAKKFGVGKTAIFDVIHDRTWNKGGISNRI